MRIGLLCIGLGPGADPRTIELAARAAERCGFASLWAGEHVAAFSPERSPYPYAPDGVYPLPPDIPLLDPFIALTWAAAVTSTIRIGTAITILPQRQPTVLAKQIATIDHLSGGRFVLGAGLGWSRAEYAACGTPWERRGARAGEYIEAMRALWAGGPADFDGEFVQFADAYCAPTPVRGRDLPVLIGGESDAALRRVARHGNGWHALNRSPEDVRRSVERLHELARDEGRDPEQLEIVVAPSNEGGGAPTADEMKRYADAGVDELSVIDVSDPSAGPDAVVDWVERLARTWVEPAQAID